MTCGSSDKTEQGSAHRIKVVQIHGLLKIAIAPLTASNDRYLCIYLKYIIKEIIAKIRNAI